MDQPLFTQTVDHPFRRGRIHPDQTPQVVLADPRLVAQFGQHRKLCWGDVGHPSVENLKVTLVRKAQLEPDLLL